MKNCCVGVFLNSTVSNYLKVCTLIYTHISWIVTVDVLHKGKKRPKKMNQKKLQSHQSRDFGSGHLDITGL